SLALSRTSGGPMWAGPNHAALGALELWRGDLPAALAALGRGVEEVGDFEMPSVTAEVDSLHARAQVDRALRARLLGETDAADSAEAAARAALVRLEAVAPAASLPEARAEIEVIRAELTRLEDHPAGPWLAIAETWLELAQPYRAALAQWRAAEALIAAGERGSDVAELLASATATASALGAKPLAGELESMARRAQLGGAPRGDRQPELGLTVREREVLILVASGRTNRQIGEELYMSEKTASVHVSRILSKLGVANRAEAAGVAHTLGMRG
ncbi:MAG: hypothetical protein QOJ07_1851, partial [Thermoleophilaceae bacterium]|nr:hypothetical protein [Thermoleophilaceae bacterium]